MPYNNLTIRQAEILEFIKNFARGHGYPPSVRDIGDYFHMASSSAFAHLKALEKKGAIRRNPHRSRSIEILEQDAA